MLQQTNVQSQSAEATAPSARANYFMVFLKPTLSTLRLPTTVRTAADFTVRSAVPGTQAWNLKPQLQKWLFTEDASSKMRDSLASTLLTIGTSSPTSQVNFIILTPMNRKPACSLVPSHNATEHRRHWLTRCCTRAQMGLSIPASATLPAPALPASGQPWCSTLAAARSIASRCELVQTPYLLSRSFIHFEPLKPH